MKKIGLNNNQLKLIALLTMTVDHIGLLLLPQYTILRIIGRISFPIYAYLIAEGCTHTRSMGRYLGLMAGLAILCRVCFVALEIVYQCILVTFTLSILLIWLLKLALNRKRAGFWILFALAVGLVFFITQILPGLWEDSGFGVDYDFWGVMLPVLIYAADTRVKKLCITGVVLSLMASQMWVGQWYALLAVPLLALYDGTRGKGNFKYLFYGFYPLHLIVLWTLSFLL